MTARDYDSPLMGDMSRLAPGGNLAPDPHALAREEWRERLEQVYAERRGQILRSAGAAVVRDRETAGMAADLVKMARQVRDKAEAERLERSGPFRETANALAGIQQDFWDEVRSEMERVDGLVTAWDAEEDARIAQQREEQEQAMAAMRQPVAPVTEREARDYRTAPASTGGPAAAYVRPGRQRRVQGDYGGTLKKTTETVLEIEDVKLVPEWVLNAPAVREAMISVARQTLRAIGVPAGFKATKVDKARVG